MGRHVFFFFPSRRSEILGPTTVRVFEFGCRGFLEENSYILGLIPARRALAGSCRTALVVPVGVRRGTSKPSRYCRSEWMPSKSAAQGDCRNWEAFWWRNPTSLKLLQAELVDFAAKILELAIGTALVDKSLSPCRRVHATSGTVYSLNVACLYCGYRGFVCILRSVPPLMMVTEHEN